MKLPIARTLFAVAAGALALTAATGAYAHGDDDHWRGRGWGHHKHHHDWRDDHRRYYDGPTVIRERVIVHDEPVVIAAPRYYEPRYYRRDPAVVIGVDIPPLVIPLR